MAKCLKYRAALTTEKGNTTNLLVLANLTSLFVISASFLRITSTSVRAFSSLVSLSYFMTLQMMFFLGLESQPPTSILRSGSFPVWLRLDFETWLFLQRFIVVKKINPSFFASGNSLPNSANNNSLPTPAIFAKISCSTGFRDHIESKFQIGKCAYK